MIKFILSSDYTSNCKSHTTKMDSSICIVLWYIHKKTDGSNHLILEYAIYESKDKHWYRPNSNTKCIVKRIFKITIEIDYTLNYWKFIIYYSVIIL